jgi:AhpC/TSA family
VKASIDRIVAEAEALREIGIGAIAIMPNDTNAYPQDSFDNMKAFAARHGFTFPYVIDPTQEIARAYDAQCTPDFFGFNALALLSQKVAAVVETNHVFGRIHFSACGGLRWVDQDQVTRRCGFRRMSRV